jgi:hypothetical protein
VVRGELAALDNKAGEDVQFELDDREQVFAHPQAKIISQRVKLTDGPSNPPTRVGDPIEQATKSPALIGRVRRAKEDGDAGRAPLAGFVSAT